STTTRCTKPSRLPHSYRYSSIDPLRYEKVAEFIFRLTLRRPSPRNFITVHGFEVRHCSPRSLLQCALAATIEISFVAPRAHLTETHKVPRLLPCCVHK